MEVEINAAQRPLLLGLAEDDCDLLVQSDAMSKMGAAAGIGADGLVHQRGQRTFAILRRLVDADNKPVVGLKRLRNFPLFD